MLWDRPPSVVRTALCQESDSVSDDDSDVPQQALRFASLCECVCVVKAYHSRDGDEHVTTNGSAA